MRVLLSHGVDVNAANSSGQTALFNACYGNHAEVARLCLEAGADVGRLRGAGGNTPLAIACQRNNVEAALVCIEFGSDVNLANRSGMTALHWACFEGSSDAVNLLLRHGASTSIVDEYGDLPLHIASRNQGDRNGKATLECARALLDHGADITRSTVESRVGRDFHNRGALPLHMACAWGCTLTTKLLLERGGNPYVIDRYWLTAFDYANYYNRSVEGRTIARMLRKFLAIDIRLCVLGTAAEYPRRNRLRDLVPHIASYIV